MSGLTLYLLEDLYAVCRLEAGSPLLTGSLSGELYSVTATSEEVSVVCPEGESPPEAKCERGWRCLKVSGPLDFSQTGVLASLAEPLAKAEIPIFVLSTYDTDYVLVKISHLDKAQAVLREAGHLVRGFDKQE